MESNVLKDLVVVKRSGQRVSFNGAKIAIAIKSAFEDTYEVINEKDINSVYETVLTNIIDNLKTPTTITVMTYAYSMGSIILMAGYNNPNVKKRCYKFSTALLHAGSSYLEGNSTSVKDQFNFYQKFEDIIKDYTLSHSKITPEEYEKMERYEWYMTSDIMLEKGLVDEII